MCRSHLYLKNILFIATLSFFSAFLKGNLPTIIFEDGTIATEENTQLVIHCWSDAEYEAQKKEYQLPCSEWDFENNMVPYLIAIAVAKNNETSDTTIQEGLYSNLSSNVAEKNRVSTVSALESDFFRKPFVQSLRIATILEIRNVTLPFCKVIAHNYHIEDLAIDVLSFDDQTQQTIISEYKKLEEKTEQSSTRNILKTRNNRVLALSIHPSDPNKLISGSSHGTLTIHGKKTHVVAKLSEAITALTSGHKYPVFATGQLNGEVSIWRAISGQELKRNLFNPTQTTTINEVSLSEDDTVTLAASENSDISIFNTETGKVIRLLNGHELGCMSVKFLDRSKIVSGSKDETVKVWDLRTGDCIQTLTGHNGSVTSVQPLPQDSLIASSSDDGALRIHDIRIPESVIHCNAENSDAILDIALSSSGQSLFCATDEGYIDTINLDSNKIVKTFEQHSKRINCITPVAHDQFATGSDDGMVKISSSKKKPSKAKGFLKVYKS